jgi:hypothetical protein
MPNLAHRLAKMESAIAPREPLCVTVWSGQDVDAAVARAREVHKWPDDAMHPVNVTRFSWKVVAHA